MAFCLDERAIQDIYNLLERVANDNKLMLEKEIELKIQSRRQERMDEGSDSKEKTDSDKEYYGAELKREVERHCSIGFRATCSDGSYIKFENTRALLDFPNASGRCIQSISAVAGTSVGQYTYVSIEFNERFFVNNISVEGSGDDKSVVYYTDEALKIIDSCRRWYDILHKESIFLWQFLLFLVVFLCLTYREILVVSKIFLGMVPISENDGKEIAAKVVITFFLSLPITMILSFLYSITRKKFFPIATFATGAGIRRKAKLDFIHNFMIVTIAIGIAIGVVVNHFF
jgi:hypothetical protein